MLEVSQLTRLYGDFLAVDNVSFNINKTEIVGLLGHNGAGKTTIMKMLSGFLEPNQGSIKISNVNIADNPKVVQQRLGYLPENLPVYPEMSVADYLEYAAHLKGLSGNDKFVGIRRAVKATEIQSKLSKPISTLSRGYKQRVGVAQAVLGKPELLILDEPTNGLDPTQTDHMRALIQDIATTASVILSTHIMQEVDAVCERVIIIRDGQLVVDKPLMEIRHDNTLLLSTDMPEQVLLTISDSIVGVSGVKATDSTHPQNQFQLTLDSNCDQQAVSANLAKAIVNDGASLFQLKPQQRDLDTLFREVSYANRHTSGGDQ